jgi:hypothetical protein
MYDMQAGPIGRAEVYAVSTTVTELLWAAAAVCFIAIIGSLKLFTPFDGDQALFLYMAEAIDEGKTLYVDVWDMKQPGIFWFFWMAGKLFGFTTLGVKLLELAWMLALAGAMTVCLRHYFAHPWLGAVAAVAALASYYTFGSAVELTQIEMLISLPMFLSAWFLVRRYPSAKSAWIGYMVAGSLAGTSVVFKLPYAIIFIVMVLLAIYDTAPSLRTAELLRRGWALLVPYTLGVGLVLAATCLAFWLQGTLDELLWVSFALPFLSLEQAAEAAPLGRLVRSLNWYAACLGPWLVFAMLSLPRVFHRDEPALTRQMFAWIVLGGFSILMQMNSFWHYHFLLLFVPSAILAARGIDLLLLRLSSLQTTKPLRAAVLSLFLVLPAMGAIVFQFDAQVLNFYQMVFSGERIGLEGYRRAVGVNYGWVARKFESLRVAGGGEPIYVFGNPLIYLVAQRKQALPIHGWSWEVYPEQLWAELPRQLEVARPAYVFLARYYRRIFPQTPPFGPQVIDYLDRNYHVLWDEDAFGRLYRRRVPPPDGGAPALSALPSE